MNLNNLLKFIFIFLFFVLSGEIGYLIFSSNQKNNSLKQQSSIETPVKTTKKTENVQNDLKYCVSLLPDSQQKLNTAILEGLKNIDKISQSYLKSSTIVNQYRGTVETISIETGENIIDKKKYVGVDRKSYTYGFLIKIKNIDPSSSATLDFAIPQDILSKVYTYNSLKETIDLNQIKINDDVTIEEHIDLTDKNCVSLYCLKKFSIIKNN